MNPDGRDSGAPSAAECVEAGTYCFERGDFEAARAWWEYALELDPERAEARANLQLFETAGAFRPAGTEESLRLAEDQWLEPPSAWDDEAEEPLESARGHESLPIPSVAPEPSPASAIPDDVWHQALGEGLRASQLPPMGMSSAYSMAPLSTTPPFPYAQPGLPFPYAPMWTPAPWAGFPQAGFVPYGYGAAFPMPYAPGGLPLGEGPERPAPKRFSVPILDAFPADRETASAPRTVEPPTNVRGAELAPAADPFDFAAESQMLPSVAGEAGGAWDAGPAAVELREAVPFAARPKPVEHRDAGPVGGEDLVARLRDRVDLDDCDGALEILERIPEEEWQTGEVRELLDRIQSRLQLIYESKVGSLQRVPRLLISEEELIWMSVDHRVGYILSQIDGRVTYDDLVALSGMPRIQTLRILGRLLDEGVIGS